MSDEVDTDQETHQYLTFVLAGEEYAINILKVQEIRSYEPTTRIPSTPDHLLGVINLRGSVVPIVDLRTKFNLIGEQDEVNRVVILVKIQNETRTSTIGIRVDAVSDVYTIGSNIVTAAPEIADNGVKNFVTGLATVDDKMIIILDIDALITTDILEVESLAVPDADSHEENSEHV